MEGDRWRAEPPKDGVPDAVRHIVSLWQASASAAADIAHAKRTLFLAYVAEGFTEAQALDLIRSAV